MTRFFEAGYKDGRWKEQGGKVGFPVHRIFAVDLEFYSGSHGPTISLADGTKADDNKALGITMTGIADSGFLNHSPPSCPWKVW